MTNTKKLVGIASFRIINSFRNGIISGFLAIYLRENLFLSVTESNLLSMLLELIGALAQFLIWGAVVDKYNVRNSLIVVAETIPAIGYIGVFYLSKYLLSTSGSHVAGLSIVFGISSLEFFWGAGFVGFFALLADLPNPAERSRYMGYTISLTSVAYISGTFVGGLLFDYKYPGGGFGEGLLYFIISPIIFGFALFSWFTRKETELKYQRAKNVRSFSGEPALESSRTVRSTQDRKREPNLSTFYWILVGLMISALARGAAKQITIYYLRLPEVISLSAIGVSLLITVRWVGYMVSGPVASKLSGRSAAIGYLVATAWFAILPLLYPFVGSLFLAMLLYASNGVARGISAVTVFVIVSDLIPKEKRGRLLSQFNAGQMLAVGAGGSVIGGPLADWQISQGVSLASSYTFTLFAISLVGFLSVGITVWKARPIFQKGDM